MTETSQPDVDMTPASLTAETGTNSEEKQLQQNEEKKIGSVPTDEPATDSVEGPVVDPVCPPAEAVTTDAPLTEPVAAVAAAALVKPTTGDAPKADTDAPMAIDTPGEATTADANVEKVSAPLDVAALAQAAEDETPMMDADPPLDVATSAQPTTEDTPMTDAVAPLSAVGSETRSDNAVGDAPEAAASKLPSETDMVSDGLEPAAMSSTAPATLSTTGPPPPPKPEPQKELEGDAEEDPRPRLVEKFGFYVHNTTMNIMPSVYGNLLMPLTDGCLQYFLAGARTNIGLTGGRYLFEVKIVEVLTPQEPRADHHRGKLPSPKHILKLGFATSDSSLFLGENEGSICFDSDGAFTHNKKELSRGEKLSRDQVVGVLLNLVDGSPNANTISIFRDGCRIAPPLSLPEALRGKPLFPALTFRCVTVQVNFELAPLASMPFKCRMIQDVAQADATFRPDIIPKDGKYEVLFPVCLPDEGTFDWLDLFLEKRPEYTEVSDRMLLDWTDKSGIQRVKTNAGSNDKPGMITGIPHLDSEDFSLRRILTAVAPMQQRNLVVMEVAGNLLKDDRTEFLRRYNLPHFKRIALVLFGEPTRDFKEKVCAAMLKEKQDKTDIEFKRKQLEAKQKKQVEKKQNETQGEVKKEGADMKKEELEHEQDDKLQEEEEDRDECPPQVELTENDKKSWFWKPSGAMPDLTPLDLSSTFTRFTIPVKDEGFDDIKFEWQKKAASAEYLKEWVLTRKIITRIEDLQPSDWFREQWTSWQSQLQKWHGKLNEWKDPVRLSKEKDEATPQAVSHTEENSEASLSGEGDQKVESKDIKKEKKRNQDDGDDDIDELDIFGVKDICNVRGDGEPLFANFAFEDWALLSLRFELNLLVHAFRRDVSDPERKGIHQDNIPFYYNKYFKKAFTTKYYGVDSYMELVEFIEDTVTINENNFILESHLPDDLDSFDIFVKLTEESRRERQLRLDVGDSVLPLSFSKPHAVNPNSGMGAAGAGGSMGAAAGRQSYDYNRYRSEPYQKSGCKGKDQVKGYGPQGGKPYGGSYGGGYSVGKGGYAGGKPGYPPQGGYPQAGSGYTPQMGSGYQPGYAPQAGGKNQYPPMHPQYGQPKGPYGGGPAGGYGGKSAYGR